MRGGWCVSCKEMCCSCDVHCNTWQVRKCSTCNCLAVSTAYAVLHSRGLCFQDCPDMNGESATQSLIQSAQAFVQTLTGATDASAQQPGNPLHPTAPNQQPSATGSNSSPDHGNSFTLPNSAQSRSASASDHSPGTGSSNKLPAVRAGPARHRSELHTLDPAQSEAALQRLRVSDAATVSSDAHDTPTNHLHGSCEQSLAPQPQAKRSDYSSAPAQSSEQPLASQPQVRRSGHSSAPAQNSSTASDQNRQASGLVSSAGDDLTVGSQSRPVSGFVTSADLAQIAQLQLQQRVGRVGVQSLGGLDWGLHSYDHETERQLFTAVLQLKALMRESRCAAMVSFPAGMYATPQLTQAPPILHAYHTVYKRPIYYYLKP